MYGFTSQKFQDCPSSLLNYLNDLSQYLQDYGKTFYGPSTQIWSVFTDIYSET